MGQSPSMHGSNTHAEEDHNNENVEGTQRPYTRQREQQQQQQSSASPSSAANTLSTPSFHRRSLNPSRSSNRRWSTKRSQQRTSNGSASLQSLSNNSQSNNHNNSSLNSNTMHDAGTISSHQSVHSDASASRPVSERNSGGGVAAAANINNNGMNSRTIPSHSLRGLMRSLSSRRVLGGTRTNSSLVGRIVAAPQPPSSTADNYGQDINDNDDDGHSGNGTTDHYNDDNDSFNNDYGDNNSNAAEALSEDGGNNHANDDNKPDAIDNLRNAQVEQRSEEDVWYMRGPPSLVSMDEAELFEDYHVDNCTYASTLASINQRDPDNVNNNHLSRHSFATVAHANTGHDTANNSSLPVASSMNATGTANNSASTNSQQRQQRGILVNHNNSSGGNNEWVNGETQSRNENANSNSTVPLDLHVPTYTRSDYDNKYYLSNAGGPEYADRRSSFASTITDIFDDDDNLAQLDFFPPASRHFEWMGRSIESLILGHTARAPLLALPDGTDANDDSRDVYATRRRSTASTFAGGRRRSSTGANNFGSRRGSLSLSNNMRGGTLANYRRRRSSLAQTTTDIDRRGSLNFNGPLYRRRGSTHTQNASVTDTLATSVAEDPSTRGDENSQTNNNNNNKAGPNVVLKLTAREFTGKPGFARYASVSQSLLCIGGSTLYRALDRPAAGMLTEVAFLTAAIDAGDWSDVTTLVARLAPRLLGDGSSAGDSTPIDDPNLPPTAPRYYAGGGRQGLERDTFYLAGGVKALMRIFREKGIVGEEVARSNDARDLSKSIVANRLALCWNEALACLRELVYYIPAIVDEGMLGKDSDFLPFLFTLLAHDACFDAAVALIEEILSWLSQAPQQQAAAQEQASPIARRCATHATTFYLGNVPQLYTLWRGFSCRQLAHFCRILAVLLYEPEDRQWTERMHVFKSVELLQLRRNRAVRAGVDSTVDLNQSILVGDPILIERLLQLLRIMNYAPSLQRTTPYHVMHHFPFVADTLLMVGLSELDDWREVTRQDNLARQMSFDDENDDDNSSRSNDELILSELGGVADMLESLSASLVDGSTRQGNTNNQLSDIIRVITAASQAGVLIGRGGSQRRRRQRQNRRRDFSSDNHNQNNDATESAERAGSNQSARPVENPSRMNLYGVPLDGPAIQGLASVAGILTDQVLLRRFHFLGNGSNNNSSASLAEQYVINTPSDAANSLQFNAMIMGSHQVEVLFVLSSLLGGRRKVDFQDLLCKFDLTSVLNEMFQRLPWFDQDHNTNSDNTADESIIQTSGIHRPGCECTPESALCIQYLRLLHNFCDRDCGNYLARRLLLSKDERQFVFDRRRQREVPQREGLLSKIIRAFIREPDDSPYRFWLASCIESYLRGSSSREQLFVAQSGLLDFLVQDISNERLRCAGSLQTTFDLLGELGKGNADVVELMVSCFDENQFRKIMSIAAANLVDSNVFIRSLMLSLEHLCATTGTFPQYLHDVAVGILQHRWKAASGVYSRRYLSHSWWDVQSFSIVEKPRSSNGISVADDELIRDKDRESDWFPSRFIYACLDQSTSYITRYNHNSHKGFECSVGHYGWMFSPANSDKLLVDDAHIPNSLERLSWFLFVNQAHLLRDLLGVVDLRNINHENICCLNTAVIVAVFAHRRCQLASLVKELRRMNEVDKGTQSYSQNLGLPHQANDTVDRVFVEAMRTIDLNNQRNIYTNSRSTITRTTTAPTASTSTPEIGDRADVMRNFRELLWFWLEYYQHRGRDRLSLEFSSQIRFQEWKNVVSKLIADDGSPTALVSHSVRVPHSPYQRAAHTIEGPVRTS